jgi:cytochrome c biogenesis protein ResB
MRAPFKALRSIKLAIFLLAYFAITGMLATLVPQGREPEYYRATMPDFIARIVADSGFSHFYGSLLFLVPAFAFFANLSACAAYRFARELKKDRKKRRHGPDIVHLGLILLVASVVAGQAIKRGGHEVQGFVRLGAGEAVQLSEGRILLLKSLRQERYADGRPKDWVSEVELWKTDGSLLLPEREIRVNHPLRLGGLSIYQGSYDTARVLKLRAPTGATRSLAGGESLDTDAGRIVLMSVDIAAKRAIARLEPKEGGASPGQGAGEARTMALELGSGIGPFKVEGMEEIQLSGLMASYDPAFPAILASLAVSVLGIFIVFARKLGGEKA